MRRIRFATLLGLALAALATVPGSALGALPEFSGPFPKAFTSTSELTTFETVSANKVVCKADTDTGEITGPNAGIVTIRLTGCESGGLACNSAGAAVGEIVTNVLTATLLYRNRELKTVGLELASPPTGAPFAEFTCGGGALRVVIRGAALGALTPVNKKVKPPKGHYTLKFKKAKGLEMSFGGGPPEGATLTSTDKLTFGEVTEVKA
jgi:hypothetical protein